MVTEQKHTSESIIKKWGLGSLIALGAVLVVIIVRLEMIPVIEERLAKKIEIQNEHEDKLDNHHVEFLEYQLKEKDKEIEKLKEDYEYKLEKQKEFYELKIDVEVLKATR